MLTMGYSSFGHLEMGERRPWGWENFKGFDLCGHGGESDMIHLTTT